MIHLDENSDIWLGFGESNADLFKNDAKKQPFKDQILTLQDTIKEKFNVVYQVFTPTALFSEDHLKFIVHHVNSSFCLGVNISAQPSMEFLLYLSQLRQIKEAIARAGAQFSDQSKEPISYGEVIFGLPQNVKKAVNFLKENYLSLANLPFPFSNSTTWGSFLQQYSISLTTLQNILKSNNIAITPKMNTYETTIRGLSEQQIQSAISDAINQAMVELFINNWKKNV